MQGQRGVIGSFAETLDFDHGTTSNNATVDQQSYWNHVLNIAENQMPDYMLSPSEMNIAIMDSSSYERPNLSRWCLGEPSSSNIQNEVSCDERKAEFGWSSSISPFAVSGPRFEERPYEPISNFSLDNNMSPMFTQGSNSDAVQQSLNLTAGIVGLSSNTSQTVEYPNTYRSIGSENEHIPPASGSDSFLLPEENTGLLVGENDGRPGSLEGRLSCKRKAIEGNAGQSSIGGSSSYLQHTARSGVSAQYNAGCSLGLSASSAEANPRHGIGGREVTSSGLTDSSAAGISERSHRNLRLRINNPSNQQNSIPPPICPSVRTVRHASVSSSQMPPHPVNHTLDLRPASMVDNMNFQSQPGSIHAPSLQQNVRPLRWSGGSTSRAGSSTSGIYADRDGPLREDIGRSMARRMLDHPIFLRAATDLRNFVRHPPTRSLNGGSITAAGTVASTSQTGSGPVVHPSTGPTWLPHHNPPPQYPRRLSEFVRRSLVSSSRTDSGALNSSHLPIRAGQPSSSEEMVLSEAGSQGHHQHQPRSALWLERHNEGIHHRLRSLAASSEGSDRLVSEIRNVFDLMRRGESLRVEDVMILDQSAFLGVADMHDRHRDMRLDVDNMSYEELLALEERIGNVSTGLSEETILNRLKLKKCSVLIGSQFEAEPCCICQEQYNEGEDLGSLECGHDFHTGCIKQWLMHKNLCPICKTTGLAT